MRVYRKCLDHHLRLLILCLSLLLTYSLTSSLISLTATRRTEQTLRVHQDSRAASEVELQRQEGEEPRRCDNGATGHPYPGVPQCHLDLAGLPHGHQAGLQDGTAFSGDCFCLDGM